MRPPPSLVALLISAAPALAAPQVVQKSGDAPHLKPGGTVVVRADCPSGRAAVSGGYDLAGAAPGVALLPVSNHPYSADGRGWTGWTVTVLNTGDRNAAAHLDVYAACE